MKRVVLDTNVLVSFLTDRDAGQQAQAAALFETAAQGELELVLHQMVVAEMVYVLGNLYQVEAQEIASMVGDLMSSPGVRPVDELRWTLVLELWPDRVPDFADAVLAAVTLGGRYDSIATFDRRFVRRLRREKIPRYWPDDKEKAGLTSA